MKFPSVSIAALAAFASLNVSTVSAFTSPSSISSISSISKHTLPISHVSLKATIEATDSGLDESILTRISASTEESKQWAEMFDLTEEAGAAYHALFTGIRSSAALGVKGKPFYLKSSQILHAMDNADGNAFEGFFTFDDLAKAVEDDFLDANRGSTDNRQGWKVMAVSTPRGSSFQDARMTLDEVNLALEKGTVIFNTAGSHIPKLASATLACCDAAALPCALNMYVTAAGKRTSAPPHTDRQDVIVIQTQGQKHWRVYSPPDPAMKPDADMYARGKGDDNLPLYSLEEGQFGCQKLLDVTLEAGDVLFIPAAFPHTTDTVSDLENVPSNTSIHLTFNFDTHVWDLNYLSARRLALMRAGVNDSKLGQMKEEDNRYVGEVNKLAKPVRDDLLSNLPLNFLDDTKDLNKAVDDVTAELERISKEVDPETYAAVPSSIWKETVQQIQNQGVKLFDVHRDMYLAAIEEGRLRKAEEAMTAHLEGDALKRARAMTPEKMQRLSLFRVQKYYEQIDEAKKELADWATEGSASTDSGSDPNALPQDWAFTLPVKVGDQVEADLGGAFFPATVTKASGNSFDVKFFDGDVMNGLDRSQVKLLSPPKASAGNDDEEMPPPGLTKKELKRWRKKQEKSKAKKGF